MESYINPLTDFGFKKLFGTEPNKDLLIDFLNQILDKKIKDLTYATNEHLGNTLVDRRAVFDLYCVSETGERFIVEMQKAKQNFFKDRSVFYATFPIQEQAKTSTWNFKLDAVYLVGILDFVFDKAEEEDDFIHYVSLKDQQGATFYDKLHFVYIELPKFKKEPAELISQQDKWLYVLRHLQNLKEMPDPLKEPVFEKLFHSAALANMNTEERKSYESSLKYYRDMQNVIETHLEEGEQKGVKKVARKLKAKGMDFAFITEITGLSQEEIEAL